MLIFGKDSVAQYRNCDVNYEGTAYPVNVEPVCRKEGVTRRLATL